jgi:hypothetical protein
MYKLLIDTCVWLEIVKDYRQRTILAVIEDLVKTGNVELIVPCTVLHEFHRNKGKVSDAAKTISASAIKRAKEVAEMYADESKKSTIIHQLNDLEIRLPILGDTANDTASRIAKLLSESACIELTNDIQLRASQRAIDRRAPFHRGKNEINDAIIIETYADQVRDKSSPGTRFEFVTHNWTDFSLDGGNQNLPHVDISALFSRVRSRYFIKLTDAIYRIDRDLVSDLMMDYEWTTEPRSLTEILANEHELTDTVWYNRHQVLKYKVETGRTKIVEKETFPVKDHSKRPIQRDIWEGATKAAARMERQYGLENLGPWTNFEWGMINGKLSALRWVLGDDWDMLDT